MSSSSISYCSRAVLAAVLPVATSRPSRTTTSSPRACSSSATRAPVIPAPTTATSHERSAASGAEDRRQTVSRRPVRLAVVEVHGLTASDHTRPWIVRHTGVVDVRARAGSHGHHARARRSRTIASIVGARHRAVLELQRTAGNRAVAGLVHVHIQAQREHPPIKNLFPAGIPRPEGVGAALPAGRGGQRQG